MCGGRHVVQAKAALSPLQELDEDTFQYLIETISIRDPASLLRFASASKEYYQRVVGWLRVTSTLPELVDRAIEFEDHAGAAVLLFETMRRVRCNLQAIAVRLHCIGYPLRMLRDTDLQQMSPDEYAKMMANFRCDKNDYVEDMIEEKWNQLDDAAEDEEDDEYMYSSSFREDEIFELHRDLKNTKLKIPLVLRMFWLQVGGVCFGRSESRGH